MSDAYDRIVNDAGQAAASSAPTPREFDQTQFERDQLPPAGPRGQQIATTAVGTYSLGAAPYIGGARNYIMGEAREALGGEENDMSIWEHARTQRDVYNANRLALYDEKPGLGLTTDIMATIPGLAARAAALPFRGGAAAGRAAKSGLSRLAGQGATGVAGYQKAGSNAVMRGLDAIQSVHPANAIDNLFSQFMPKYKTALAGGAARTVTSAGAGGSIAAIETVLQGGDFGEVGSSLVNGAVFGSLGNIVLGEALYPVINKYRTNLGEKRLGYSLLSRISGSKPGTYTMESVDEAAGALANAGEDPMGILGAIPDGAETFETARKFGSFLQKHASIRNMQVTNPNRAEADYIATYEAATARMTNIANNVVKRASERASGAFGNVVTPKQAAMFTDAQGRVYADVFEELGSDAPGTMGGTVIPLRGSIDRIETSLMKSTNRSTPAKMPPGAQNMMNRVRDAIRTDYTVPSTGKTRSVPTLDKEGRHTEGRYVGEHFGDTDIIPQQGQLYQLVDARRELASLVRAQDPDVDAASRLYGTRVLKAMDEEIERLLGSTEYGDAMKGYAASRAQENAYELGRNFHNSFGAYDLTLNSADEVSKAMRDLSLEEYKARVSPEEWRAFQEGFTFSFKQEFDNTKFNDFMNKNFGKVSMKDYKEGAELFFDVHPAVKGVLEEMVGPGAVTNLLSSYDDRVLAQYTKQMKEFLEQNYEGAADLEGDWGPAAASLLNSDLSRLSFVAGLVDSFVPESVKKAAMADPTGTDAALKLFASETDVAARRVQEIMQSLNDRQNIYGARSGSFQDTGQEIDMSEALLGIADTGRSVFDGFVSAGQETFGNARLAVEGGQPMTPEEQEAYDAKLESRRQELRDMLGISR